MIFNGHDPTMTVSHLSYNHHHTNFCESVATSAVVSGKYYRSLKWQFDKPSRQGGTHLSASWVGTQLLDASSSFGRREILGRAELARRREPLQTVEEGRRGLATGRVRVHGFGLGFGVRGFWATGVRRAPLPVTLEATGRGMEVGQAVGLDYVKTSNRSRNICNRLLTPVTSTHICNSCCLAPVTYKRARTTPVLASTTPVTNVDF
jgi:hypothetical protein